MSNSALSIQIRLSVMMFLQFFVWGAWFVTVGNYMAERNMTDSISAAYSVGYVAAMISPFFLGMVADRFFSTQKVLGVLHLLGGVVMILPPMLATPEKADTFVLVIFVHMLCYMPTLGLVNTLSFHNLTNQEKQFPLIRVFGTLGWIAANNVVSGLLGADKTDQQFYVTAGAAVLLGVYSFFLPSTPPPARGKKVTAKEVLGLEALSLLRDPSFAIFVVCSFLICIPLAAYYAYAPVFISSAGVEKVGSLMSLGQVSEVFFMVVMPLCFARLGVKWMLAVGMLAWVIRYGAFAGAADNGTMALIVLGVLLHGICYDFFFVTGQIYVDQKAPLEVRGKAQGLLVFVTIGVGMLIGTLVSGELVAQHTTSSTGVDGTVENVVNWFQVWIAPTVGSAVILLIFVSLFRRRAPKKADDAAGAA